MPQTGPFLMLCGLLGIFAQSFGLSLSNNNQPNKPAPTTNRRQAMAVVFGATTVLLKKTAANAACIAGDTSVDCIGSFKETIPGQKLNRAGDGYDDITINNYSLRAARGNVVLTTPQNFEEAIGILSDQRLAMEEMENLVSLGRLEEAGVVLLAALPKLTVAGRFVVGYSPPATRIRPIFEEAENSVKALDQAIAMGMRGHSGSLTVAQLVVLKDLALAKTALDDLIKLAKVGQAMA